MDQLFHTIGANQGEMSDLLFPLGDHQHSTRLVLDADDALAVRQTIEYTPFGEVDSVHDSLGVNDPTKALDTAFAHHGSVQDETTGLSHKAARWYNPTIGRFLTEDPIGEGTNHYRFAGNDPVNFADPSGLSQEGKPTAGGYSGGVSYSSVIGQGTLPGSMSGIGGHDPGIFGSSSFSTFGSGGSVRAPNFRNMTFSSQLPGVDVIPDTLAYAGPNPFASSGMSATQPAYNPYLFGASFDSSPAWDTQGSGVANSFSASTPNFELASSFSEPLTTIDNIKQAEWNRYLEETRYLEAWRASQLGLVDFNTLSGPIKEILRPGNPFVTQVETVHTGRPLQGWQDSLDQERRNDTRQNLTALEAGLREYGRGPSQQVIDFAVSVGETTPTYKIHFEGGRELTLLGGDIQPRAAANLALTVVGARQSFAQFKSQVSKLRSKFVPRSATDDVVSYSMKDVRQRWWDGKSPVRPNPDMPRGREYMELSHTYISNKGKFGKYIPDWIKNRGWNLKPMWGTEHALVDPGRYQFMKKIWKADNALHSLPLRLWGRMPTSHRVGAGVIVASVGYGIYELFDGEE